MSFVPSLCGISQPKELFGTSAKVVAAGVTRRRYMMGNEGKYTGKGCVTA
jgi:hypothetical protein